MSCCYTDAKWCISQWRHVFRKGQREWEQQNLDMTSVLLVQIYLLITTKLTFDLKLNIYVLKRDQVTYKFTNLCSIERKSVLAKKHLFYFFVKETSASLETCLRTSFVTFAATDKLWNFCHGIHLSIDGGLNLCDPFIWTDIFIKSFCGVSMYICVFFCMCAVNIWMVLLRIK